MKVNLSELPKDLQDRIRKAAPDLTGSRRTVTVWVPSSLFARMEGYQSHTGLSKAAIVRAALIKYLPTPKS